MIEATSLTESERSTKNQGTSSGSTLLIHTKEEVMKLNARAFALSAGIIWGVIIFLVTNINLLRGGKGEFLSHLSQIYVGYSCSFGGSLIGLIWGFVTMFVAAWVFAFLYNTLLRPGSSV
jgi:hypothetical protein